MNRQCFLCILAFIETVELDRKYRKRKGNDKHLRTLNVVVVEYGICLNHQAAIIGYCDQDTVLYAALYS